MICQRCDVEHGATIHGLGRYSTPTIADVRDGLCQHCDRAEQYQGFLYRRAGSYRRSEVEISADWYGVQSEDEDTMFADTEGSE